MTRVRRRGNRPTGYIRWDPERNEATVVPADRKAGGITKLTRAEVVGRFTPAGLNHLINHHGEWIAITVPAKPAAGS